MFHGAAKLTGCAYDLTLRFDAALPEINCYTLQMHANWGDFPLKMTTTFAKFLKVG